MNQLKKALITHKKGDEVVLKVYRGDNEETINLNFD